METHRDRLSARIQAGRQRIQARRAVGIMRHVVFAAPHHLHRRSDCFGDFGCVDGVVHLHPASESATQERGYHFNLLGLQTRRTRDNVRDQLLELRRGDDHRLVSAHISRGVLRLHGRVRQERQLVGGLDRFCRLAHARGHVTLLTEHCTRLLRCIADPFPDLLLVVVRIRAGIPLDLQQILALLRLPVRIRHDCDTAAVLHHRLDSGHRLGARIVVAGDLAPDHWRHRDCGVEHAGHPRVDTELRRTVDFGGSIEAFLLHVADQLELARRFERDVLRHFHSRRLGCDLAVVDTFAAGASD